MLHIAGRFGVLAHPQYRRCLRVVVRTIITAPSRTESVNVPVGGGGEVQLDITHTIRRTQERPSILVHLPARGSILSPRTETARLEVLRSHVSSSFPSTTLISIQYRLGLPTTTSALSDGEVNRFPQPIHDTTIAFSHIIKEVVPSLFPAKPLSPWKTDVTPKVALVGSHIGAALATMLALTHPNDIHSVAIANPLVDWVILDELLRPPQNPPASPRMKRPLPITPAEDAGAVVTAAKQLIDVRTKLFSSPSAYFDPFASPTLFLRAPGRDTPRTHAEALGMLDDEMSFNEETDMEERVEAIGGSDEYTHEMGSKAGDGKNLGTFNIDTNGLTTNDRREAKRSSLMKDLDTITEAIGADSFGPYDDDQSSKADASPSSSTDTTITSTTAPRLGSGSVAKQVKRRKVFRRWPPLSRPEDVMLPYFNVFVSPPSASQTPSTKHTVADGGNGLDEGLNAILRMQGTELVDLLRRACFYGREKGVGERRVVLTEFGARQVGGAGERQDGASAEEERMRVMVAWLRDRLEGP